MQNVMASVILIVWLVIGVYFGIAGYVTIETNFITQKEVGGNSDDVELTYDGIVFKSKSDLKSYITDITIHKYFKVFQSLPNILSVIITSCSFGLIGVETRLFYEIYKEKIQPSKTTYLSGPILGVLAGIFVTAISYILPNLLISTEGNLRPMSISFISLFAGIFIDKFYEAIIGSMNKIINIKVEK